MTHFAIGDIFTDAEIARAARLCDQHKGSPELTKILVAEIVEPVLERIDQQTGRRNSAAYLAYSIVYIFNEFRAMADDKEPAPFTPAPA